MVSVHIAVNACIPAVARWLEALHGRTRGLELELTDVVIDKAHWVIHDDR